MPKIWSLPHVGPLTGEMRIPIDKSDGGTANDTAHVTPDDILDYVEENLDIDVDASAITSPDASVSLTATDAGLVVEGAEEIGTATHGLGVTAEGAVGLIPLGLSAFDPETTPSGKLVVTAGADVAPSDYSIDELGAALVGALSPSIESKAPLYQIVDGPVTSSFAAVAGDAGKRRQVSVLDLGGLAITLDAALFGSGQAGRTWWTEYVVLTATYALSFVGTGGLDLSYYGPTTFAVGDVIRVTVESATVCRVETTRLGETAATPVSVTSYTSGSGNYTIPAGAKAVLKRVWGGGGGGGGGASQTSTTARSGGAGGGGGAHAEAWETDMTGGTIAYSVGAGGTAGAAGTTGADGGDGGAGGASTAGGLSAFGGGGGRRGQATSAAGSGGGGGGTAGVGALGLTTAVAGGAPGGTLPMETAVGGQGGGGSIVWIGGRGEFGGGAGGGHSATPVNYVAGGSLRGGGGGGQGAGAGAGPSLANATAGGQGGSYSSSGGGGGAGGTSGASPTAGTAGAAGTATHGGSGGGGGGASITANTAGAAGGAGGARGGGGGGGGCGEGSASGGAGGAGGAGLVVFIAFF